MRRGAFIAIALVGVFVLMVFTTLFIRFSVLGLRQERSAGLTARSQQVLWSLHSLAKEMAERGSADSIRIDLSELLPPGTTGAATLSMKPTGQKVDGPANGRDDERAGGQAGDQSGGHAGDPSGGQPTVHCEFYFEQGSLRFRRTAEWRWPRTASSPATLVAPATAAPASPADKATSH